ncbi:hypothetical protein CF327_g2938 [Tilletia walkeri]|nr:hypothetical protein CF327_g2938 [Tilletia walkeri]
MRLRNKDAPLEAAMRQHVGASVDSGASVAGPSASATGRRSSSTHGSFTLKGLKILTRGQNGAPKVAHIKSSSWTKRNHTIPSRLQFKLRVKGVFDSDILYASLHTSCFQVETMEDAEELLERYKSRENELGIECNRLIVAKDNTTDISLDIAVETILDSKGFFLQTIADAAQVPKPVFRQDPVSPCLVLVTHSKANLFPPSIVAHMSQRRIFFSIALEEEVKHGDELRDIITIENLTWKGMLNKSAMTAAESDNATFLRRTRGNHDAIRLATILANRNEADGLELIRHHLPHRPEERMWRHQRETTIVSRRDPSTGGRLRGYYGIVWRSLQPHEEPLQFLSFKTAADAYIALQEYRQRVNATIYRRTFTDVWDEFKHDMLRDKYLTTLQGHGPLQTSAAAFTRVSTSMPTKWCMDYYQFRKRQVRQQRPCLTHQNITLTDENSVSMGIDEVEGIDGLRRCLPCHVARLLQSDPFQQTAALNSMNARDRRRAERALKYWRKKAELPENVQEYFDNDAELVAPPPLCQQDVESSMMSNWPMTSRTVLWCEEAYVAIMDWLEAEHSFEFPSTEERDGEKWVIYDESFALPSFALGAIAQCTKVPLERVHLLQAVLTTMTPSADLLEHIQYQRLPDGTELQVTPFHAYENASHLARVPTLMNLMHWCFLPIMSTLIMERNKASQDAAGSPRLFPASARLTDVSQEGQNDVVTWLISQSQRLAWTSLDDYINNEIDDFRLTTNFNQGDTIAYVQNWLCGPGAVRLSSWWEHYSAGLSQEVKTAIGEMEIVEGTRQLRLPKLKFTSPLVAAQWAAASIAQATTLCDNTAIDDEDPPSDSTQGGRTTDEDDDEDDDERRDEDDVDDNVDMVDVEDDMDDESDDEYDDNVDMDDESDDSVDMDDVEDESDPDVGGLDQNDRCYRFWSIETLWALWAIEAVRGEGGFVDDLCGWKLTFSISTPFTASPCARIDHAKNNNPGFIGGDLSQHDPHHQNSIVQLRQMNLGLKDLPNPIFPLFAQAARVHCLREAQGLVDRFVGSAFELQALKVVLDKISSNADFYRFQLVSARHDSRRT